MGKGNKNKSTKRRRKNKIKIMKEHKEWRERKRTKKYGN